MTVKKSYFTPATNWSQEVKLKTFICSGGDSGGDPDFDPFSGSGAPARKSPLNI